MCLTYPLRLLSVFVFFFKQKTAYEMRISDWSSDVCSSDLSFGTDDGLRFTHRDALYPLFERAIGGRDHDDLAAAFDKGGIVHSPYRTMLDAANDPALVANNPVFGVADKPSGFRSEERRGGKEWVRQGRYRWSPSH